MGKSVGAESDRVAALEAELERSERRREAAEQWAEFLERELEAREERLDSVIEQYEAQLAEAKQLDTSSGGLWDRLTGWFPRT
jgi:chromosome segregation ATPase